jgi:phosphoenolpyruvate-protein phosphotransferase
VADDLTPSEIAQLAPTQIQGIALANSAPTAHSAILARSLGIPMVCILGPSLMEQRDGHPAIVDGNRGQLLLEPEEELYQRYHRIRQDLLIQQVEAMAHAAEPAITLDGVPVPVYANANSPEDVRKSQEVGADGVGLLRTEYLFRSRATPPTVEEQRETYTCFLEQVRRLLTVRALDAGGDKPVEFVPLGPENNPFLGLRGIRLLLARPELLQDQWLALQQAAASLGLGQAGDKEIRFMLPMVSTVDEVETARSILAPLAGESPRIKLGIMIEVPSAALLAGALAPLVDFFSIGTNDLSQYVLASDRTNSRVAQLADPLHPAVLQLIHLTCQAANGAGKPVSVCGEIAGDPTAVPLLLGLGVSELSVPLPAVPLVKQVIRRWTLSHCRQLAETALRCASALEVRNLLAQES